MRGWLAATEKPEVQKRIGLGQQNNIYVGSSNGIAGMVHLNDCSQFSQYWHRIAMTDVASLVKPGQTSASFL